MRDLERIAEGLRRVLRAPGAVTRISPLTTGYSNETYLIEGPDLILRLPPAAGAMLDGHDVLSQARIYAELAAVPGAPPVPSVVAAGGAAEQLGVSFFVMERVAGEAIHDIDMQPWFVDGTDEFRRHICRNWVQTFAALARLAPLDVLGPSVTPEAEAGKWQEFARKADCGRLVDMFARLLRHPAPRSGPPAVVHGDAKLSNVMWLGDEVSAVLDWEMALNGEPLADLGYLLYAFHSEYHAATRAPKLPGMLTRAEVIALWSQVSGRSADGLLWHEIAQIGKVAAIVAEGSNMYLSGRSSDPKLGHFVRSLNYYLDVMTAMLDGASF